MSEEERFVEEKVEEVLSMPEDVTQQQKNLEQGKHLLEEGQKEDGVKLLIEASNTGNKEATDILKQCLETGEGISAENEDAVEWCVKTPKSEKHLKHAISELFNSLKKEGQEKVSVGEIGKAIRKAKDKLQKTVEGGTSSVSAALTDGKSEEELGLMTLLSNVLAVGDKKEVTVGEFMDTAMSYAKGDVPELVVVLNEKDMEKYEKANLLEKVLKYPHQSAESFKHYVLVNISKRGSSWVKSLIPTAQIQMLLLLYLYNQLTPEMFMFIIPLIVFYISMAALIVFSLQMFYGREALRRLKSVSELVKRFDPMVDEKEAEAKFMWRSITPYIWFFVALMIGVASFTLCDKAWIPCSELSLIALFFTVSALRGLPSQYDDYAMYTIGLKVLTTILVSLEGMRGMWVLCHPFMSIPLPYGLQFHISLPSVLHIVILAMLVVMAGRHSWRGVYKVLIPHLVCLLWWQMFAALFHHTTWRSLFRASLGWVILITMLPLLIIYLIGIFLISFMQWFLTLDFAMKLAVTAIAVALSSVIIFYSNIRLPKDVKKRKWALLIGVAVVVLFLLGPLLYANYVPARKGHTGYLPWDLFDKQCGPAGIGEFKKDSSKVDAVLQARCSEYIGETVRWKGKISYVRIDKVENKFRSFVMAMPSVMRPTLRCLMGSNGNSADRCNLSWLDRYTFGMGVEVASVSDPSLAMTLKVKVEHGYYNTMMKIKPGDEVTVKGYLETGLGTSSVSLSLRSLFMNGARVKPIGAVQREDVFASLKQAARYSVEFFFSPLINQQTGLKEEDDD